MRQRVAWMLPGAIEGSGGLRTIFGKANALAAAGIESDFYCYKDPPARLPELAGVCRTHLGAQGGEFYSGSKLQGSYDAAIATFWDSVKLVRDQPVRTKLHFVQDYEAWFNPMSEGYLLAETAFWYGVQTITLGRWLARMLSYHFDKPSFLCDFGIDQAVYQSPGQTQREDAVCFIFQPEKPRRCWPVGIEALGIVKAARPGTTIYLYGSHEEARFWFDTVHLKMLQPAELAELYQRCRVGLCLSPSNPSRIPFEMMACGLPVVDLYRTNNLYDYPSDSILLAHQAPESLAAAILGLLDQPRAADRLAKGAGQFIAPRLLAKEDEDFVRAVTTALRGEKPTQAQIDLCYRREAVVARVYDQPSTRTFLRRQRQGLEEDGREVLPPPPIEGPTSLPLKRASAGRAAGRGERDGYRQPEPSRKRPPSRAMAVPS